jgi:hypothetical protein
MFVVGIGKDVAQLELRSTTKNKAPRTKNNPSIQNERID